MRKLQIKIKVIRLKMRLGCLPSSPPHNQHIPSHDNNELLSLNLSDKTKTYKTTWILLSKKFSLQLKAQTIILKASRKLINQKNMLWFIVFRKKKLYIQRINKKFRFLQCSKLEINYCLWFPVYEKRFVWIFGFVAICHYNRWK